MTHVIIGGGPSVTAAQIRHVALAKLDGLCTVTAINDAVYLAWWADRLYACDGKWWRWHWPRVHAFPGRKVTIAEDLSPDWPVERIKRTGREGFDPSPGSLRTGSDSGYQALHLAAQEGHRRILLLGYDMNCGEQTHWFGDHPDVVRCDLHGIALPKYPMLKQALDDLCVDVMNCSPGSALTIWPSAQIETVL